MERGLPLPLLLTIVLAITLITAVGGPTSAIIEVYPDGWCVVSIRAPVEDPIVEIPLLGQPTLLSVVDEEGLPLNYTLDGDRIVVDAEVADEINVTYETQSLTYKRGLVWSLNVSTTSYSLVSVRLMGDPDVVGLSKTPISIREGPSYLELTIEPPFTLDYVYTSPPGMDRGGGGGNSVLYYLLALLPALAMALFLLNKGSRDKKFELDSTDMRILNSLAEGEKSLSTIRVELSLPKTTAWRRVRRLESEGLVEVERTRSGSLIRLSKLGREVLKDRGSDR